LYGSLPDRRVFPPGRLTSGKAFVAMDRLLDQGATGPRYLQREDIASAVVAAIHEGERLQRYQLHAFVVMPNHVHILVTPSVKATQWLGPLKGFTAHECNKLLGQSGHFWQDESYDHLVRNEKEFFRIQAYIEENPVKAGLVAAASEFSWSSATGA
jgi:putative transposase